MQIEKQHEDYYRKLGTPLGAPKMKGATVDPENTHESYNTIIKGLGGHCVPAGWIQRPKRNIALRQEKNEWINSIVYGKHYEYKRKGLWHVYMNGKPLKD